MRLPRLHFYFRLKIKLRSEVEVHGIQTLFIIIKAEGFELHIRMQIGSK